ncbi:MAG: glycosyltransferase family 2 protein [Elusimicrobia bacterium]|nr:glycosyltransferase family 2 protein [Elusimicrobiota bacterium]
MLPGALSTVLRQTCGDYEVLIVDDGSTDDTPEMIKEWTKDERFKYTRVPKNIGNMACRNMALEMASGTWITNIDSDDFWTLDRLQKFADFFRERPAAGFVFSNGWLHRYDRLIGSAFPSGMRIREGKVPGHYAVGEEFLPYLTTNLAIPRALYKKYGHYRSDMIILDNELYARMLADGVEVGVIYERLAIRRIHEGQVTHKWLEEYPEGVAALVAGGTPPDVIETEKKKLVREIAIYLIKNLQPLKAREFMLKELGGGAKKDRLYAATMIPRPVLAAAREARKAWLKLRRHPAFASAEERAVYELITPLINDENKRAAARPPRP